MRLHQVRAAVHAPRINSTTLQPCSPPIQVIALALLQRNEEAMAMAEADSEEDQVRAAATLRLVLPEPLR